MIQSFVDRFMAAKPALREQWRAAHPDGYAAIIKAVVGVLRNEEDTYTPDVERIECIDWGGYHGTKLYVIGAEGCQPSTFWCVAVGYGSCSGCDTFEGIYDYSSDAPTDKQLDEYLTLALHIVQGIRQIAGYGLVEE